MHLVGYADSLVTLVQVVGDCNQTRILRIKLTAHASQRNKLDETIQLQKFNKIKTLKTFKITGFYSNLDQIAMAFKLFSTLPGHRVALQ